MEPPQAWRTSVCSGARSAEVRIGLPSDAVLACAFQASSKAFSSVLQDQRELVLGLVAEHGAQLRVLEGHDAESAALVTLVVRGDGEVAVGRLGAARGGGRRADLHAAAAAAAALLEVLARVGAGGQVKGEMGLRGDDALDLTRGPRTGRVRGRGHGGRRGDLGAGALQRKQVEAGGGGAGRRRRDRVRARRRAGRGGGTARPQAHGQHQRGREGGESRPPTRAAG